MIPRLVKITQCTQSGSWYELLRAEEFVVLEAYEEFYLVATFDGYGNCIPSLIKICDCTVIEFDSSQ